ncbi:hypothetical protein ACNKHQ_00605 [Shigella flexneri]
MTGGLDVPAWQYPEARCLRFRRHLRYQQRIRFPTCATTWHSPRGHVYSVRRSTALVDEVDSVLIDEARTPLIISGPAEDSSAMSHA